MNPPPTPPEEGSQCRGTLDEFPSWEGPGAGRFMGSLHDSSIAHWDHEPPLTRPPATLSPSDGEREGVRGRGSWKASSLGPLRTLPACFKSSDYLFSLRVLAP